MRVACLCMWCVLECVHKSVGICVLYVCVRVCMCVGVRVSTCGCVVVRMGVVTNVCDYARPCVYAPVLA